MSRGFEADPEPFPCELCSAPGATEPYSMQLSSDIPGNRYLINMLCPMPVVVLCKNCSGTLGASCWIPAVLKLWKEHD